MTVVDRKKMDILNKAPNLEESHYPVVSIHNCQKYSREDIKT